MRTLFAPFLLVAGAAAADGLPKLPPLVTVIKSTATSTYNEKKNDAYAPWRVLGYTTRGGMAEEPVIASAWCEGKPDEGIGEAVTFTFGGPVLIDDVQIAGGVWLTDKLFKANNKITKLEIIADGGAPTVVSPKVKEWVTATLGKKVTTLTLRVAAVTKGRMNDSCLSAVDLMQGERRIIPLFGIEPTALVTLPTTLAAINAALSKRDPSLKTLVEFPITVADANGFFYGQPDNAVELKSYEALVAACKSYDKRSEKADDYVDPKGCPSPSGADENDERGLGVDSIAPGVIEISFPSSREVVETWTLAHEGGRWRLTAIGYH